MRIRKRNSGSAATPALLSLLLVMLVVVTVYVFASNLSWAAAGFHHRRGPAIDHQYDLTLAVTGTVFILSQLGLAFAVFRFRDHGQQAHFTRGNNTMEVIWTTATIVLFLGLGIDGPQGVGGSALHAGGAGRDSGGSHGQPVRFQFPLSRARMENSAGSIPKQISASTGKSAGH